ncbi:Uncharacterized protein HZ326_20907 [Fusarium oxysporum f. sp. albedinis]|nr:Uncharacterized protein HZ326_20907 [Fusarium oxysporum f. sp. albedinis]
MPMPFYQELAAFSNTVTSQEGSVSGCTAPLGFGRSDLGSNGCLCVLGLRHVIRGSRSHTDSPLDAAINIEAEAHTICGRTHEVPIERCPSSELRYSKIL